MIWFLYNILFTFGFVLMLPNFLRRMCKRGGYRDGFKQRFAIYPPESLKAMSETRHVWVHAVSVGECNVAQRYMAILREQRPDLRFVFTTTTSTGYTLAKARRDARDQVFYFPVDFPWVTRRALKRIQPACIILTEGELWPNLIRLAHARDIPIAIINGRISDGSFRGYSKLKPFVRRTLACVNTILAQTEQDQERYVALGADPTQVRVRGTAKFDMQSPVPEKMDAAASILEQLGMPEGRPLIVGGSTWPGEEAALCRVLQRVRDSGIDAGLVLVPRHAERAREVVADIEAEGMSCCCRSRLAAEGVPSAPDVFVVDTTGELSAFYAKATLVYVGKSLFNHGGQNMLEPSLMGKPVIVGPNTENFTDAVRILLEADGIRQVHDEAALVDAVLTLLRTPEAGLTLAQNAQQALRARQGVVQRSVEDLLPLLEA